MGTCMLDYEIDRHFRDTNPRHTTEVIEKTATRLRAMDGMAPGRPKISPAIFCLSESICKPVSNILDTFVGVVYAYLWKQWT